MKCPPLFGNQQSRSQGVTGRMAIGPIQSFQTVGIEQFHFILKGYKPPAAFTDHMNIFSTSQYSPG